MYKAAIIGCGRIGITGLDTPFIYTHAEAYRSLHHRVNLSAVVDTDSKKAESAGNLFGVPWYTDWEEMVQKAKPNIISLCTPVDFRYAFFSRLPPDKGIAVWCEKPMARDPWEAGMIVRRMNSHPVQINYIRRFDTKHQQVKESMDKGELGEILWVRCLFSGGMLNNGSHFVDLCRWWGVLDKAKFHSTDRCKGTVTEVEIMGTEGRIRLTVGGLDTHIEGPGPSPWFPTMEPWVPYERAFRRKDLLTESWPKPDFMQNALTNILDHLDFQTPLLCPAQEGLDTLVAARMIADMECLPWNLKAVR